MDIISVLGEIFLKAVTFFALSVLIGVIGFIALINRG